MMLLVVGAFAIATGLAASAVSFRALPFASAVTLACCWLSMSSAGWSVLAIVATCIAALALQQAAYLAGVFWRIRTRPRTIRFLDVVRSKLAR